MVKKSPSSSPEKKAARIAALNDAFRQGLGRGTVLLTQGIQGLENQQLQEVVEKVQNFSDFTPDNDPYGEHDFGSLEVGEHKIFWKIDIFENQEMKYGSEHPDDPERSYRVMTVMLAEEY